MEPEQLSLLDALAKKRRASTGEVIRRAIETYLNKQQPKRNEEATRGK